MSFTTSDRKMLQEVEMRHQQNHFGDAFERTLRNVEAEHKELAEANEVLKEQTETIMRVMDTMREYVGDDGLKSLVDEKVTANNPKPTFAVTARQEPPSKTAPAAFFIEKRKTAGYVEYIVHTPDGVPAGAYFQHHSDAVRWMAKYVRDYQHKLIHEGYALEVDGTPGPKTLQALADWKYKEASRSELAFMVKRHISKAKPKVEHEIGVGTYQVMHDGTARRMDLGRHTEYLLKREYTKPPKRERRRMSEPMTKEEYERSYELIKAVIRSDVRWGWHVYVDQHDGVKWQYWRPSKKWAESTARRAWAHQIDLLNRKYRAGQTVTVQAPLGVQHMTKSALALTIEQEHADREKDMQNWDAEFKGGSDA